MHKSSFQLAIERGMAPDADLYEELRSFEDYKLESREDALAVCDALRKLPRLEEYDATCFTLFTCLGELAGLFQDIKSVDSPAFEVLRTEGSSQLVRIFDAMIVDSRVGKMADDLLRVLKMLAWYRTKEGADRIIQAATLPLTPDSYPWHVTLSLFAPKHPHRDHLFEALSNPLPPGFIAMSLLDSANTAAVEGDLKHHPFDSQEGYERLQGWLLDRDPGNFSYAHSATTALPFISDPARHQLLALAMDHPDESVQLEAATASARLGSEAGLRVLVRYCCDENHSDAALKHLNELGRADLIPDEARSPTFRARADFARWLAHPNELGQSPDRMEVIDHRYLAWPPSREVKPFWIIRYHRRAPGSTELDDEDTDCGLVGSVTFCLFRQNNYQRHPEDVYAIHCGWELGVAKCLEEKEVFDSSFNSMLDMWRGGPIRDARITHVAELSPDLKYPTRLVAVASALRDEEDGWLVLDGVRSAWYPASEQPAGTRDVVILRLHIGRQLLDFHETPDRCSFLKPRASTDPRKIIDIYEQWLDELLTAEPLRQKELIDSWGPLSRHFNAYLDANVESGAANRDQTFVEAFERLFHLIDQVDPSIQGDIYWSVNVIGTHLNKYLDLRSQTEKIPGEQVLVGLYDCWLANARRQPAPADARLLKSSDPLIDHLVDYSAGLRSIGRAAEIPGVVKYLATYFDYPVAHGALGSAAYLGGDLRLAEEHLEKVLDRRPHMRVIKELSTLADIWHANGETDRARELLTQCLQNLTDAITSCKHSSDLRRYIAAFHKHAASYRRLFPEGEDALRLLGIPADPMTLTEIEL